MYLSLILQRKIVRILECLKSSYDLFIKQTGLSAVALYLIKSYVYAHISRKVVTISNSCLFG